MEKPTLRTFCDPSQYKEGRSNVRSVEDIEEASRVAVYPGWDSGPILSIYLVRERSDMEVILHIYGQCIQLGQKRANLR